jgi:LysR family hydrogen peroxide-inducible transcriptional activator
LPELALLNLDEQQRGHVKEICHPKPMREVSLVVHRSYLKKQLIEVFKRELLDSLPESVKKNTPQNVIDWVGSK